MARRTPSPIRSAAESPSPAPTPIASRQRGTASYDTGGFGNRSRRAAYSNDFASARTDHTNENTHVEHADIEHADFVAHHDDDADDGAAHTPHGSSHGRRAGHSHGHGVGHHGVGHHNVGHHDFGHHNVGHHDFGHHGAGHHDFGHHGAGHHGHHEDSHFSVNFHYGSHYYPYYYPYSHYDGYPLYTYGYGYSPIYHGYYSDYNIYSPSTTYSDDGAYSPNGDYYYPRATVVTPTPAPHYETADNYADQPYAGGWSNLSRGRPRSAFRYFSHTASGNPEDALPKVGYSIASAMLGDHHRAAWAMRRAFNTDPYSISSIQFDTALLNRIDHLAEDYADKADDATNPDADFMLAALSFLIHDNDLAEVAIHAAIEHGDASNAARTLQGMIPETDHTDDN